VFATSGAVADLTTGTVVGGADVGRDAISRMEAIGGTLGDDTLTGDDGANRLAAFSGDDELHGAGGDDSLEPGTGDDTVDGGEGSDLADYFSAGPGLGLIGPINIDLAAQTATSSELGADALTSIEGGGGTVLDDTMMGSAGPDFFIGDDGADTLTGGKGDDYLDGDAFFFGFPDNFSGPDALNGEGGTDTCLGGESVENCEETDPSVRRWSTLQRVSALARSGAFYE
jgi:Ca2+-binding RTX toxin-like protein